jgi:chemotaxis protein methyltransferase CheR
MDIEVYQTVKGSIKKLLNIDLNYYKDEQMRRRLDSWLTRTDSPNWQQYFKRLAGDHQELSRFRNYLTINVSEFFRDKERWRFLREDIIPYLLQTNRSGALRVWSAGCSTGQEIYSLAMLLNEMTPTRRHTLLATDIDRGALTKARARGPYAAEDVRNLHPGQMATYFEPGGPPYLVKESLSSRIQFCEQNMVEDPFENNFDLIVCRNVIIYFTAEAKDILYPKFFNALRPGGVLFLGGTEIVPRPQEIGFSTRGFSFYIKDTGDGDGRKHRSTN